MVHARHLLFRRPPTELSASHAPTKLPVSRDFFSRPGGHLRERVKKLAVRMECRLNNTDPETPPNLLLGAMNGRLLERWQIALFGGLLQLTWWIRKASLAVERRLL